MKKKLKPITPGEILSEEFLRPLGISQNQFARDIDVPVARVNEIIKGKRTITADSALRFAIYFGVTPEFWLDLQSRYSLKILQETFATKIGKSIRPYQRRAA